jgi:transcriptional regulator with XRE-family HTH domain
MSPGEIELLRKSKKLTQKQLGELCGVSNSAVSNWESGRDAPSGSAMKILKRLAAGDLVVSQLSELEMKLLEQNVRVGGFRDREDYLTASLKHLLVHGRFLELGEFESLRSEFKAAEDPATFEAKHKRGEG